ncbi:hypothetical protein D0860_02550 [Hortaea werneckii]|uniref:Cytochrome P450 n=1 Tax=Hortaea werneckii TaxID=91943 RepID=A0A3M7HJ02_HORWE|nr:hypothetical protein D0860_02550 [Hortaea werneckii]
MATATLLLAASSLALAYGLGLIAFRLLLHPLARVPGPKIAAITGWYEFYWDCPKSGQYVFRIRDMHKRYGPIVRISPREVHIDDPAFFDTFYSNSKLDKDAWFYRAFGDNGAAVGTASWEQHKARRGAMAKFFSSANVAKLEPKVLARVKRLLERVEEHKEAGKIVDISNAFRCFSTDVISDYAAPESRDFLSTPDFSAAFNRVLRDFSELMLWHRHFPIVFPVMNAMPKSLVAKTDPSGASIAVIENQEGLLRNAQKVVNRRGLPEDKDQPTVLDAIYQSPLLGPEEKTVPRILAETQAILGAGTETTGNTLSVFTYHVLSQPEVLKKLKAELQSAASKPGASSDHGLMNCKVLDRLPYLQACIREALRLATGVSSRLPRVNRFNATTYTLPSGDAYTFPPGTVISMSMIDLHYNATIFPRPSVFDPSRWLDSDPGKLKEMEKAYAPFGRGARQCVGLELAKEEITLMTGNLFHRFDMDLFETSERDVSIAHDYFAPFAPKDSKGVRVMAGS